MINIVLIGAGKIAEKFHLPAWRKIPGIKVVGIADKDINKAKILAKKFNIKNYDININKIIKKCKIDAVDICTSNDTHQKIILNCLDNNLHVLCEKPFVVNFKSIKKIKNIIKKKNLICIGAQHQRFRRPSQDLKKLILKNTLGNIYSVKINSLYNKSHVLKNVNLINNDLTGGPLLDLGSHFVDLALWLLNNANAISVNSFTSNTLSKKLIKNNKISKKFKVPDYCSGSILLKKKIILNYELSYLLNSSTKKYENLIIYGDKANISWPNLIMTKLNRKNKINMFKKEITPASVLMLKDFINKIRSKKKFSCLDTIENGLKIIDALKRSAKKKRTVYFENI